MLEEAQEEVKCPIGRKRLCNIKTAVTGDEKVVVQIISKVRYHGKFIGDR